MLIPICGFIIKVGIYLIMNTCFLAGYGSDALFPLAKRSTANGIVNVLGVFFTGIAPIIGEMEGQIPLLMLTLSNVLCLLASFTYPSK